MQVFVIGRDLNVPSIPGATGVEVTHPQVSSPHISIELHRDGRMFVTDLRSANGTRINQEKHPIPPGEPRKVTWDDVLYLGSFRYPLRRLQEEHLQQTMTVTDVTGQFAAFVVQPPSYPTLPTQGTSVSSSSVPALPTPPSPFVSSPTIELDLPVAADAKKSRTKPTVSLDVAELSLDFSAISASSSARLAAAITPDRKSVV